MATSSTFLFLSMWPMPDIPVTAFWVLSIWLGTIRGAPAPFVSGLACGVSILIRPNLFGLIAVMPIAWAVSEKRLDQFLSYLVRFMLGAAPGVAIVALVNTRLYGSPLLSGYGDLEPLYAVANSRQNLLNYIACLSETQTWFFPAGLVALAVPSAWIGQANRRTRVLAAFAVTVVVVCLSVLVLQTVRCLVVPSLSAPAVPDPGVRICRGHRVAQPPCTLAAARIRDPDRSCDSDSCNRYPHGYCAWRARFAGVRRALSGSRRRGTANNKPDCRGARGST